MKKIVAELNVEKEMKKMKMLFFHVIVFCFFVTKFSRVREWTRRWQYLQVSADFYLTHDVPQAEKFYLQKTRFLGKEEIRGKATTVLGTSSPLISIAYNFVPSNFVPSAFFL